MVTCLWCLHPTLLSLAEVRKMISSLLWMGKLYGVLCKSSQKPQLQEDWSSLHEYVIASFTDCRKVIAPFYNKVLPWPFQRECWSSPLWTVFLALLTWSQCKRGVVHIATWYVTRGGRSNKAATRWLCITLQCWCTELSSVEWKLVLHTCQGC